MTVSLLFLNKMAVNMGLSWVFLVLSLIGVNASGQLAILHNPASISFTGSEQIRETMLKEAFSAALGLSTEPHGHWDGLYIVNPFDTPEAAVEVYVDGVQNLGDFGGKTKTYPLVVDVYEPETFDFMKERIKQRFPGEETNRLVNIRLSDSYDLGNYAELFGEISVPKVPKQTLNYLKYSVEEDYQFLTELQAMKAITAAVKSSNILKPDNKIDFYNFRFSSLHALSDYHGVDSLATKEAKTLLNEATRELKDAFVHAYDGNVLFAAVSTDVAHTRRYARALRDADNNTTTPEPPITPADPIDNIDYPVIFNIILWFSVVITFTMIAIVYAIMDMDPGRDSIIYRMTSTRIKKDN